MNADDFANALTFEVPARIRDRGRRVYFDAATKLHAAIIRGTPVDTGYLRASLTASAGSNAINEMEARDPEGVKTKRWRRVRDNVAQALSEAAGQLVPITFTFRASYAQYVEDVAGMVKQARARWREFTDAAVKNADVAQVRGRRV